MIFNVILLLNPLHANDAYLIYAHKDLYVLKSLLSQIDSFESDIFLHIDIKSELLKQLKEIKETVHKSKL